MAHIHQHEPIRAQVHIHTPSTFLSGTYTASWNTHCHILNISSQSYILWHSFHTLYLYLFHTYIYTQYTNSQCWCCRNPRCSSDHCSCSNSPAESQSLSHSHCRCHTSYLHRHQKVSHTWNTQVIWAGFQMLTTVMVCVNKKYGCEISLKARWEWWSSGVKTTMVETENRECAHTLTDVSVCLRQKRGGGERERERERDSICGHMHTHTHSLSLSLCLALSLLHTHNLYTHTHTYIQTKHAHITNT